GQGRFEMLADLATECGNLPDEIAAVTNEQLQAGPELIARRFAQGEAVDGGAVNGGQVGIVGLVARIGRLAELLSGEGMDDARLEAGRAEGALDDAVIAARAFDGDKAVAEVVVGKDLTNACHSGVKGIAIVLHDQWRHQDLAKEIAEHPLGAGLGTINADDAEVLRSHLLHARMDDPAGLVQDVGATSPTWLTGTCRSHVDMPPEEKLGITQFSRMAVQTDFFSLKPTYQGSGVFFFSSVSRFPVAGGRGGGGWTQTYLLGHPLLPGDVAIRRAPHHRPQRL